MFKNADISWRYLSRGFVFNGSFSKELFKFGQPISTEEVSSNRKGLE